MSKIAFWTSFLFVLYVYCGYPLLVLIWRKLRPRAVHKAAWEPTVSIVIAAHNERDNIDAKIRNCLLLDYPRSKFEIIVSLDGPSDGTEDVARGYEDLDIKVVYYPVHQGKAAALNRGAAQARGEIIVFADARQRVHHRAIQELVANFSDSSVGAASGEMVLLESRRQGAEAKDHPVGLYWRYEKWLRARESDIHSCMGATGALYAIRRELFLPLPEDTILDDVLIPMRIVLAGKRVVFESAALAYDIVAPSPEAEFGRKIRTLVGNYQLLRQIPDLLVPGRNPVFFQYWSHKVGRLLVPYGLVTMILANCLLLHGFYLIFFALQVAFYLLALAGRLASGNQRPERMSEPVVFRSNAEGT